MSGRYRVRDRHAGAVRGRVIAGVLGLAGGWLLLPGIGEPARADDTVRACGLSCPNAAGRMAQLHQEPHRYVYELSPLPAGDEKVYFSPGSVVLSDEAEQTLDRQAEILKRFAYVKAKLFGPTDIRETESKAASSSLGYVRAFAARDYLAAKGVSAASLEVGSRGASAVIVLKDSDETMARLCVVTTEIEAALVK